MSAPDPVPDDLVRRAAAGEATARDALVREHSAAVWGLCRRLDREPEDAFQDAWAHVLPRLGAFDPEGRGSFRGWLLTIVHRRLVDRHRRRAVRGEVLPMPERPTHDDVEGRLDTERRRVRLEAALQRLPTPWRRVVILHHLHGVPLTELALSEDVALGTVKSRLHRGRARLAELLQETP